MAASKRRIWGWMLFDWAQQPYATLGLTFIFSPYFAAVAASISWPTGPRMPQRQTRRHKACGRWARRSADL